MKPLRFKYAVEVRIELTREEVETLRGVAERHYDSKVRGLSKPGFGAVLNGYNTMLIADGRNGQPANKVEGDWTTDQLQLMTKGLEGAQTPEERRLYMRFNRTLRITINESARANTAEVATPEQTWWNQKLGL